MIFVQKPQSYGNFMQNIVTSFDYVDQLKQENKVSDLVFDVRSIKQLEAKNIGRTPIHKRAVCSPGRKNVNSTW